MAVWSDVKYGVRVLGKAPGFTAVAVLTLALGIGLNTAIFTVVYGVLLRPLPFPEPDRIYELTDSAKGQTEERSFDYRELLWFEQSQQSFEQVGGYTPVGLNLTADSGAEHLPGMHVSTGYFPTLGIAPILGRNFLPEEDRGEGQRVALVAYSLWKRRFGGDPGLVGRTIRLNGEPYTVIGVLPRGLSTYVYGFINQGHGAEIFAPLALAAKTAGSGENIGVIARLKRGVTPVELQGAMMALTRDFLQRFATEGERGWAEQVGWRISVAPYRQMIAADERPYLLVLLGAIGFVLLIACANLANLLLARGSGRTREVSVRLALGATRGRLVRQLLTESLLIAVAGGVLGFALGAAGLGSRLAIAPSNLPRMEDVHLDWAAFAFTFGVAVATGVLFGVAPAVSATRANLSDALKEGAGRSSAGTGRARLRQVLVAGELAMSLVLLTGAGLMIETFVRLMNTDPGFEPHHVLTMQFWLTGSQYDSTERITDFYRKVEQKLAEVPGLNAASVVAAGLPFERGGNEGINIAGTKDNDWRSVDYREITPGYFYAMGVPLRLGRVITDADSGDANHVTVVNETFVKKYLAGREPIGEHIRIGGGNDWLEIVGVVGDTKSYVDRPSEAAAYIPAAQASYGTSKLFEGWFPRTVVVRAKGDPLVLGNAVREALTSVDASVPMGAVRSMDQVLSHSLELRGFLMVLLSLFGGLALVLAGVGIYGVISYTVSQRTREIGVRMALGARPSDVLRLILSEGMKLALVGLIVGVGAALLLTRLLQQMVYGVSLRDPLVFAGVNVLMILVALAACYVPARRAMRVDPNVSLRYE